MKNIIELNVKINDVLSANLFLRAVWAKLRLQFGGCPWQFSPVIFKQEKQIWIGNISLPTQIEGVTEVWITYKTKGGIDKLIFKNHQNDISLIESLLLPLSKDFKKNLNEQYLSTTIESNYPISNYRGKNFRIEPLNNRQSKIAIKVSGYDYEDCRFIAKQWFDKIIDLLASSLWDNITFSAITSDVELEKKDYNINIFSENLTFNFNDDNLVKDKMYYLPQKLFLIIDEILNDLSLPASIVNLISASQLFHSALKMETIRGIFNTHNIDLYEILITHYMSALEVLANSNDKIKKCDVCGQNIFSISKSVKDFLEKVFSKEGGEFHVKRLHALYTTRSKFLHTGKYFSNRSYFNVSIPQLKKSDELIESQYIYDGGGTKYYIGNCFSYYLNNIKIDSQVNN